MSRLLFSSEALDLLSTVVWDRVYFPLTLSKCSPSSLSTLNLSLQISPTFYSGFKSLSYYLGFTRISRILSSSLTELINNHTYTCKVPLSGRNIFTDTTPGDRVHEAKILSTTAYIRPVLVKHSRIENVFHYDCKCVKTTSGLNQEKNIPNIKLYMNYFLILKCP